MISIYNFKLQKGVHKFLSSAAVSLTNQIQSSPMVAARSAMGRLSCVINLLASTRISMMLLRSANNGASGNAAQKIVKKPNCSTARQITYSRHLTSPIKANQFIEINTRGGCPVYLLTKQCMIAYYNKSNMLATQTMTAYL